MSFLLWLILKEARIFLAGFWSALQVLRKKAFKVRGKALTRGGGGDTFVYKSALIT
jgi:hypothetical protein